MPKLMQPDMSITEMLDCFIFITKGSRVTDWRLFNWKEAIWAEERFVRDRLYSVTDMKNHFAQCSSWCNPFQKWLADPARRTAQTFIDAMQLVNRLGREDELRQRGMPTIDVAAIVRNAAIRANAPPWVRENERQRTAAITARLMAGKPSA